MEHEERITILNWPSLQKPRHFISYIKSYRIVFGINNLKFNDFFELTRDKRTRASHFFKLGVENARVNPYKYYFLICIVKEWNNLPQYVVEAESFNLFKACLKYFFNMRISKQSLLLLQMLSARPFLSLFKKGQPAVVAFAPEKKTTDESAFLG